MTRTPERVVIDGSIRFGEAGKGSIHMEGIYDTTCDDLWSACVNPGRLSHWIATVEGDLRVGGSIHARFTSSWDGPGRINICAPLQRLVVTMEPGTPDETVIEALLTPIGQQTRLVVEERGIPQAELAAHGAGWQTHTEDLGTYLAGAEPGEWRARWAELLPRYQSLAAEQGRSVTRTRSRVW